MKTKKSSLSVKPLFLKNLLYSGFLATGLLLSSFLSFAATTKTGNLPISSTVSNSCVVKSTDSINLGAYNPSSLVNLNGSGVLSLICTKGAIVTATPASGGSTLTGSNGSLSYALYIDSGMSQRWGSGSTQFLSFTGGTGSSSNNNPNLFASFKNGITIAGHATVAQIQAAASDFNPNVFYWYYYTGSTTLVYYNYQGMLSGSTAGNYSVDNWYKATASTSPNTLAYNNGTNSQNYYILPPGTTTGSTGTYGTTYQVPASIGANPLSGTSTSVKNPLNLTYYAKLPYGQDVVPGIYTDTVLIQITF